MTCPKCMGQMGHGGGSVRPSAQRHRDFDSDENPLYGQQQGHGQDGRKKRRGFLEELSG